MYYTTDKSKEFYTDEKCHIIEMLNTPEIENVSVSRARVVPGGRLRRGRDMAREIEELLRPRPEEEAEGAEGEVTGRAA